jgi:hypothetical protein
MPGYGTLGPSEGSGLLPWSWAEERLVRSHDYWLATVTPAGRPHVMPVWAVMLDDRFWFSSSNGSRKARNLRRTGYASLTTDDPLEPVVAEGPVELVTDMATLERMLAAENAKYGTDYGIDMFDPAQNSCFALSPQRVFGLDSSDFTGSPTKWVFG